jgi:hypothetical protein
MTASITMNIHLSPGRCGHRVLRKGKRPKHAKPVRRPRITRLMALSIKYEHLLSKGLVDSHGELAGLAGADRSVISRIIRLRLLAPDIQEWLIHLPEQNPGDDPVGWTEIRPLTRIVSWEEQRRKLKRLIASKGISLPRADGLACGITGISKDQNKNDQNKEK